MQQDRLNVLVDGNVARMLHEQGFSYDETPRSIFHAQRLFDALAVFGEHNQKPIVDADYKNGVALAFKLFARDPKKQAPLHPLPLTPENVIKLTSNPKGSAGLTNYGHTKEESYLRAYDRALQTMRGEKKPEPCLAFARTQFNDKTRLVWGFPYSMTVIEGLLALPLLNWFKSHQTSMAFATTTMNLGTRLRTSSYHKEFVYSLDMSQFDSHVSRELIYVAFDVWQTWFDLDEVEPTSGLTVREIFRIVRNYFIYTPIVMPDGRIYYGKDHGVPSGSYFTQLNDSVDNVILAGTLSSRYSLDVARDDVYVLGDDLLMFSNRRVDLDSLSQFARNHLGILVHGSEKSIVTRFDEPIRFLGRVWVNGIPTIEPEEVIARMVFPERYRIRSKDPKRAEREVKLLILSYAAQYRAAWPIVERTLDPHLSHVHRGVTAMDLLVGSTDSRINPDHLSGLQRFKMKYGSMESGRRDIVLQFMA
jgi:hypothetical protein